MRRLILVFTLVAMLALFASGANAQTTTYTVQPGDSLTAIANRYNITLDALAAANNLTVTTRLVAGQVLVIPVVSPPPSALQNYTVQRGDTLASIAQRFNTSVQNLIALNGIQNANRVVVGQVLRVPAAPPQVVQYTVQPGDTLYRISLRFGVSVQSIQTNNGIINPNRIFAGQVLRIVR
jgi:peptidoglycan-N-acetylglucosamine deacetylase